MAIDIMVSKSIQGLEQGIYMAFPVRQLLLPTVGSAVGSGVESGVGSVVCSAVGSGVSSVVGSSCFS